MHYGQCRPLNIYVVVHVVIELSLSQNGYGRIEMAAACCWSCVHAFGASPFLALLTLLISENALQMRDKSMEVRAVTVFSNLQYAGDPVYHAFWPSAVNVWGMLAMNAKGICERGRFQCAFKERCVCAD